MTRMNLSEVMLLEASGELSSGTRAKLQAHMAKHPETRAQFEQIKHELQLLRSMPRLELTEETRRQMASSIKQGVQKRLRQIEWEEKAGKRWKLIYRALAGVSAAAAAIVIVAGILAINKSALDAREQERIATVRSAVNQMASLDGQRDGDEEYAEVKDSIREYQDRTSAQAPDGDMTKLLTVLATVTSDQDEIMPPPEPGSL
jgi:anti-sigma factor RsiW